MDICPNILSLDYLLSVSLDNFGGHLSKYTVFRLSFVRVLGQFWWTFSFVRVLGQFWWTFVHVMLSLDYLLSVSLDNFGGHLSKYTVFRLSFVRVLGQFWWTFVHVMLSLDYLLSVSKWILSMLCCL